MAVACGAPAEPRIVPFRGGYLRLRPPQADLIHANIYPVPDPDMPFLGAHLTRMMGGEVLVGPSALMVAARDAYRLRNRAASRPRPDARLAGNLADGSPALASRTEGRCENARPAGDRSLAEAARLVPALRGGRAKPARPGVRAQAVDRDGRLVDDFVIHRTERAVHVRNAPSPAATRLWRSPR